jgi:hypothetical protein
MNRILPLALIVVVLLAVGWFVWQVVMGVSASGPVTSPATFAGAP